MGIPVQNRDKPKRPKINEGPSSPDIVSEYNEHELTFPGSAKFWWSMYFLVGFWLWPYIYLLPVRNRDDVFWLYAGFIFVFWIVYFFASIYCKIHCICTPTDIFKKGLTHLNNILNKYL